MKPTFVAALALGAFAVSACDGPVKIGPPPGAKSAFKMRTISKLTCPEKQGHLTRVSSAPDGLTCTYAAPETEVTLRLLALNDGDARAVLSPIEAELKALMPDVKAPPTSSGDDSKADIHLPGVSIKAGDEGASIRVGGVHIDADNDTAEVRMSQNVTISTSDVETGHESSETEGEDRHTKRGNIRATYILASDKAEGGYHMVAYEARGPQGGPLAVGVVKAKARKGEDHDILSDVKALLKANVGGGGGSAIVVE